MSAPGVEFVSAEEYGDIDAVAQLYTESFAEYKLRARKTFGQIML